MPKVFHYFYYLYLLNTSGSPKVLILEVSIMSVVSLLSENVTFADFFKEGDQAESETCSCLYSFFETFSYID